MADAKLKKEALAIVLDVGRGSRGTFDVAKQFCANIIQQKILFAPKTDEVSIILGGTPTALNSLNAADPNACPHITVTRPLMSASLEMLKAVQEATPNETFDMDVLDAVLVAADLLVERTRDKKYQRRIYMITGAHGAVRKKELLEHVVKGLQANGISLIVIGVDFEDDDDKAAADVDWTNLSDKQKNERVLRWICSQLEESGVISVDDAAVATAELRKRVVTQRTVSRCVMSVGDIHVPVQLFTKALWTRPPVMSRTTAKGPFMTERRYFSVRAPDQELDPSARIKALRYGKSVIPFTDVDEAALKFTAHRSLMCLCFVPTKEVPHHLLMGGVKVVVPMDDDDSGQRAFSAFVQGMAQLDVVMLARFVWRENADPTLCALLPNARKDTMYLCPLPFAEDLRMFRFRSFNEVKVPPNEVEAVDRLIDAMNIDDAGLVPRETFNPAIQQYYSAVQARLADPLAPLPGLPASLKRTACAWGEPGNILEPVMTHAAPALNHAAKLFPYREKSTEKGKEKVDKLFWFAKGAGIGGVAAAPPVAGAGTGTDELQSKRVRLEDGGGGPRLSVAPTMTPGAATAPAHPAGYVAPSVVSGAGASGIEHVTTVDPVGSFLALVNRKDEDCVSRAIFEMTEVICRLLRDSIGDQLFGRCDAAVDALRQVCIREGEATTFNKFIVNLRHTLNAFGQAHPYWAHHVMERGIVPISRDECPESDIDKAQAAALLSETRALPSSVVDEPADGYLFDELE